jgi:hypothetical protein
MAATSTTNEPTYYVNFAKLSPDDRKKLQVENKLTEAYSEQNANQSGYVCDYGWINQVLKRDARTIGAKTAKSLQEFQQLCANKYDRKMKTYEPRASKSSRRRTKWFAVEEAQRKAAAEEAGSAFVPREQTPSLGVQKIYRNYQKNQARSRNYWTRVYDSNYSREQSDAAWRESYYHKLAEQTSPGLPEQVSAVVEQTDAPVA